MLVTNLGCLSFNMNVSVLYLFGYFTALLRLAKSSFTLRDILHRNKERCKVSRVPGAIPGNHMSSVVQIPPGDGVALRPQ
jgi:hypothetical protein